MVLSYGQTPPPLTIASYAPDLYTWICLVTEESPVYPVQQITAMKRLSKFTYIIKNVCALKKQTMLLKGVPKLYC